jgi:rifampin ADP-ribosylating transferase
MAYDHTEQGKAFATFYYGARVEMAPGIRVNPGGEYAHFTANLDAAIWEAELSEGEQEPRVYCVTTSGPIENAADLIDYVQPAHPAMSLRTRAPLEVVQEVTKWNNYHGTRANLQLGDLIEPGHSANFGPSPRTANFVYFARTVDASIWGAELAVGDGRGRIYIVEPTGPIEDDPNLTNVRFRGNPTKSFRSRAPLRVVGELLDWQGHSPEAIGKMREGLARLEQTGVAPNDD